MANSERTFIAIKPDGVQRGLMGEIIKRFEQKGFRLVAMKFMRVSGLHSCCFYYFIETGEHRRSASFFLPSDHFRLLHLEWTNVLKWWLLHWVLEQRELFRTFRSSLPCLLAMQSSTYYCSTVISDSKPWACLSCWSWDSWADHFRDSPTLTFAPTPHHLRQIVFQQGSLFIIAYHLPSV